MTDDFNKKPEYNSRFHAEAKAAYLKCRSISATIRYLRARGYKHVPEKKTLVRWRDEERWVDALNEQDRLQSAGLDPADEPLTRLYKEAEAVRVAARSRLFEKNEAGKYIERTEATAQDFYAYGNAMKICVEIMSSIAKEKRDAHRAVPMEAIFEALMDHPRVGKLLRQAEIRAQLEKLIADKMVEIARREVAA